MRNRVFYILFAIAIGMLAGCKNSGGNNGGGSGGNGGGNNGGGNNGGGTGGNGGGNDTLVNNDTLPGRDTTLIFRTTVPPENLKAYLKAQSFGNIIIPDSFNGGHIQEGSISIISYDLRNNQTGGTIYLALTDFSYARDYEAYLSGLGYGQGTYGLVFRNGGLNIDTAANLSHLDLGIARRMPPAIMKINAGLHTLRFADFMPPASPFVTPGLTYSNGILTDSIGNTLRPLQIDLRGVTGWELYDQKHKIGVIMAGYRDRLGIVLDAEGFESVKPLKGLLANMDYVALGALLDRYDRDTSVVVQGK